MERMCIFAAAVAALLILSIDGMGAGGLRRKVTVLAAEKRWSEGENGRKFSDNGRPFRNRSRGIEDFRRNARDGMLRDVDGGWKTAMDAEFSREFHSENAFAAEDDDPEIAVECGDDPCADALFDRVNGISIPQIRFIDAPLSDAIASLASMAEKNDTAGSGDGINVVLLGLRGAEEPTVTLSLRNISLYRLMEFVAKSAGYCFDLADDAAIFYKRDMVGEVIETRFFPISRATVIRLTGVQEMERGGNENANSIENIAGCERGIMEFFQRAGVDFKGVSGSSLAFDGSQIIVTNTGGNLRKLANILKKYSAVKQVEIEAKFLEVQQSALDDLGFHWKFENKRNANSAFFRTGDGVSNNLRTMAEAFAASNFSRGDGLIRSTGGAESEVHIPNNPPGMPGQINVGEATTPTASFIGVVGRMRLSAMIHALEQHSGSDLMSAPKLTVLSGKTAEIVVAMELRYPQKYGDTRSEVGAGSSTLGSSSAGVTITAGTPQDFTVRNVGVEMRVTPTVENDGSISLRLEPKVTEFEGFVEYGGTNVAISSGTTVTIPSGFFQPIFSTREIRTEVNIPNGATVVMGGLTREEIREVNDKVPILGDIPLLGWLFRSKSETSQKRNLLILVTARTVPSFNGKRSAQHLPK